MEFGVWGLSIFNLHLSQSDGRRHHPPMENIGTVPDYKALGLKEEEKMKETNPRTPTSKPATPRYKQIKHSKHYALDVKERI